MNTTISEPAALEKAARRVRWRLRTTEVVTVAVWVGAAAVVSVWNLDPWARVLVAFSPAPVLAWCGMSFWRARRHLDEFGRQVIIEGAAFAYGALVPGLLVYAMVRHAGVGVPEAGWVVVFSYSALAFVLGVVLALRRRGER